MARDKTDDIDLQALERRLAGHHEQLCRTAASITPMGCAIRRCWRNRGCSGAMIDSDRTKNARAAQKFMGYSGDAVARLPFCVARASDETYALYLEQLAMLKDWLAHDPSADLPLFDRRLKGTNAG
ncbi:MAG: hypothetical protein ACOH2J_12825 [Allorhizobium sp.]